MGKQWKQWQTLFSWAPKSLQMVTTAMKLKDTCSLEESYDQPRQHIKKQSYYFADKVPSSQSYGFSNSHVYSRTDAEVEAPIFWPPDSKNWLNRKNLDLGKDWRQEEKRMTEDEMAGWHHQLNGDEFEQALGVGDGQGSLACCSPWCRKESNTTEQLNNKW